MNSYTHGHILRTAIKLTRGFGGQRCTLKWRNSEVTYDEYRKEEYSGTPSYDYIYDVPCFVKTLDAGTVRFGNWGRVEVGDLVVMISKDINLDNMPDLVVIINEQEYKAIPDTPIPFGSLSGLIGNEGVFNPIHCRYIGKQS